MLTGAVLSPMSTADTPPSAVSESARRWRGTGEPERRICASTDSVGSISSLCPAGRWQSIVEPLREASESPTHELRPRSWQAELKVHVRDRVHLSFCFSGLQQNLWVIL